MCDYPVTTNTLTNASSTSQNAISQKFEMVGGYTEDLTEPQLSAVKAGSTFFQSQN